MSVKKRGDRQPLFLKSKYVISYFYLFFMCCVYNKKMIQPMELLNLVIEAQRFTSLSGVLKRLYVIDRLGPLSQDEKELIDLLIDTFLLLCKKRVDIQVFQRRCWSLCPTSPRVKAHLQ